MEQSQIEMPSIQTLKIISAYIFLATIIKTKPSSNIAKHYRSIKHEKTTHIISLSVCRN